MTDSKESLFDKTQNMPKDKVLAEALTLKNLPYNMQIFNELYNFVCDNKLTNVELLLTHVLTDYYTKHYTRTIIYKLQQDKGLEAQDYPVKNVSADAQCKLNDVIVFVDNYICNGKCVNTELVYGFTQIKYLYDYFGMDKIQELSKDGWKVYSYNVLIKKQ